MSQSPALRKKLVIEKFEYRGFRGCRCWCDLAVLQFENGSCLVVCSEREDNPGTSVTNVAEYIATQVCNQFAIDPCKLTWVEHYAAGKVHGPKADWDLVTFKIVGTIDGGVEFAYPQWRPLNLADCSRFGVDLAELF